MWRFLSVVNSALAVAVVREVRQGEARPANESRSARVEISTLFQAAYSRAEAGHPDNANGDSLRRQRETSAGHNTLQDGGSGLRVWGAGHCQGLGPLKGFHCWAGQWDRSALSDGNCVSLESE
ncbi:hypothetical protein CCH79_00009753 [Gambusia affinis]|uniref:Secreted protein n=1 Tax=Gambusia affinis TaxID=33528 RepID=A0A315W380_GAMAF|nr:hypothetical protein CCH79_00009753 [Gambusia affinis]